MTEAAYNPQSALLARRAVPQADATRLEWLDALRGWAVLGVVLVHSGQSAHATGLTLAASSAGRYGVQLFFIVSALTISLTYETHISRFGTSRRSQIAWLTKRFFRIAPLYYLAAIFYPIEQYAIYRLSNHVYGSLTSPLDVLANLLFVHTWIPSAINSVVPGGWSIGTEMFFYLLVPFIWAIKPGRRRAIWLVAGGIFSLVVTTLTAYVLTGSFYVGNNGYFYYWFPTQAPVIAVGLIYYVYCGARGGEAFAPAITLTSLAGFVCLSSIAIILGTGLEVAPWLSPSVVAIAFLCLIMALSGPVKNFVANRYAVFLGRISFSVYICHFFVLDVLRGIIKQRSLMQSTPDELRFLIVFLAAVALTTIIALATKRFVEDPGVTYGHRLSRYFMRNNVQIGEQGHANEREAASPTGPEAKPVLGSVPKSGSMY